MKISNELDARIKKSLESDNERALKHLLNEKPTFIIPMHTSNMRMLESDQSKRCDSIRQTIIPKIIITVEPKGIKKDEFDRHALRYTLGYNNQSFPLAHVYNGSGSLCMGSIFVPSTIPKYTPQQPLETLFLYNDRHTAHGHPEIPINQQKIKKIGEILYLLNPNFPLNIQHTDWVENDTLWRIGEQLLLLQKKEDAFETMHQICHILFNKNKHETYMVNGREVQF